MGETSIFNQEGVTLLNEAYSSINSGERFQMPEDIASLEKGKLANIVIADGDILELGTHIKHVLIEGVETSLRTRYEELLEKYKR